MSDSSLTKNKPIGPAKEFSVKNIPSFLGQWFIRNKIYFLAFAIPVVIMYIAYAIFGVYPYGGESVLVLDLNGQYVYYFEAIRDAFWGDESIFYNWSRNLSGGYMGVIAYYLASPFSLIPILLPRTMILGSLQIMILSKLGLASVTFSYYMQKSKKVSPLHSVIFGVLYALCAYGVIQAMNPMWLDGVYLLPMVLLGVEYLIDDGRKLNLAIPLAMIFVFNFYIGYMVAFFTAIYFFVYLFTSDKKPKRLDATGYFNIFLRAFIAVGTAVLLAAFMLISIYKALSLGKFEFSDPDFSFKTSFKILDFIPQLLPAQYDSVNVQGLPEIYCGMLTVVLLPLFYLNKNINFKQKIGYTAIILILFFCMYINPIDMAWHGFQEPNWLPYRYSFMFSFALVSMGALAFKNLDGIKISAIGASVAGVVVLIALAAARNAEYFTGVELVIAAVFSAIYCGVIYACRYKEKFMAVLAPVVLLTVSSVELGYNAYNEFKGEDKEVSYSTRNSYYPVINTGRKVVSLIDDYHKDTHANENDGFYRTEKTFHRTVNDPAGYGFKGISHSSSVMNAKALKFLEGIGIAASSYSSRYKGSTPVVDAILGIKYSMDDIILDDATSKRKTNALYKPIFSYPYTNKDDKEARIDVFENPYALSLGFAADEVVGRIGKFGNDDLLKNQNIVMSSIAGHTTIEDGQFANLCEYYKKMDVDPNDFILSNVTTSPYGNGTQYTADQGEGIDPVVKMQITPENDGDVYIFFQTENQNKVNLWFSTTKGEDGEYYDHQFMGEYFGHENYYVLNLGNVKAGEEFELRMTVANDYTIVNSFNFYQFDEELFKKDIEKIQQQQWNITDFDGNSVKGTITVNEGQIMLTTIPYEEGWTVKVDGKKLNFVDKDTTEFASTEQCYSSYMDSLIGLKLTPGTHTVEMVYTPPGTVVGVVAFILGVVAVVFIYRYDKKNNKVLLAIKREKNQPKPEKNASKVVSSKENEKTTDAGEKKNNSPNTTSSKKKKKKRK